jgi:molybdopterin biosynthesis enzyme
MLAAAGVTTASVHARPVVTIFSTGDEVVPPDTQVLSPGQVRDATASALAALIADAGGEPVPEPSTRAVLSRDLASATGRLDVVQVKVSGGVATPMFGVSALLSVLTQADGYIVIPEEATGLDAGTEVTVTLYA